MIAIVTPFDWTEIIEGIIVSVLFILIPVVWRLEKHHNQAMAQHEKHHGELMREHRATRKAIEK
jgi:hypothetical protein